MPTASEQQIDVAEGHLRVAMLGADVAALDALISPDLIFTNHLGQLLSKQDDLQLHRSGRLKFDTLEPTERVIKIDGSLAVVSVRMKLSGTYAGEPFAGDLRYTRIWYRADSDAWRIVAGHSCAVVR